MGVAALSVAGRETTLPPMQFILVLYSSHDYPKKGGTSLLKEIRRRGTRRLPRRSWRAGGTQGQRDMRAAEGGRGEE